MKPWLVLPLFLFLSLPTFGAETYEYYNGVREMGMGGASVATVNDETALFLNPAALGRLRDYFITVADPEVEVGEKTELIAGTNELKMTNPQDALNACNKHTDDHLHERFQLSPSIVVPNFGFGVFGKYVVDAEVDSGTNTFMYDYTNDWSGVFGVNFRLWDGIIKVGANARVIDHTTVRQESLSPTSTNLTLKSLASDGMGIGSDVGVILTGPVAWLPSLAAVYRDIGRTTYDFRGGMMMTTPDRPDSTPSTLDVGVSVSPIMSRHWRATWTAEYDDSLNAYKEKDSAKKVHAGVEFNYADAFFLRGGYNQRYWTAGMELDMFNYQFQVASYGEEIGTSTAHREDRRYDFKFAFRF